MVFGLPDLFQRGLSLSGHQIIVINVNAMKPITDRFVLMSARRGLFCAVALFAITVFTVPAQAAFHLWTIREVYSDASGTLQFIELNDSFGGQNSVGGMQINVSNVGATQTHTYSLGSSLGGNTFGHALLLGTAGLQAAGGPTPDFIIPNNFLFTAGGSIGFFGQNGGPYSALPTDGTLSRDWSGNFNSVNSPQNYVGQTGTITVPEPSTWALLGAGVICLPRRSRSTKS